MQEEPEEGKQDEPRTKKPDNDTGGEYGMTCSLGERQPDEILLFPGIRDLTHVGSSISVLICMIEGVEEEEVQQAQGGEVSSPYSISSLAHCLRQGLDRLKSIM